MAAGIDATWEVAVHDLAPLVEVLHNVLLRDLIWHATHIQARTTTMRTSWGSTACLSQRYLQLSACG